MGRRVLRIRCDGSWDLISLRLRESSLGAWTVFRVSRRGQSSRLNCWEPVWMLGGATAEDQYDELRERETEGPRERISAFVASGTTLATPPRSIFPSLVALRGQDWRISLIMPVKSGLDGLMMFKLKASSIPEVSVDGEEVLNGVWPAGHEINRDLEFSP